MTDRLITPHFKESELRCRCGCGRMEFTDAAIQTLEELRVSLGFPLRVNSGYRCPEHNAAVSTTGLNGPHTFTGYDNVTVDLAVSGGRAYAVLAQAAHHGFKGVGVRQAGPHGQRFVHLDRIPLGVSHHPRPTVWSY